MLYYIARRLAVSALLLFGVLTATFFLIHLAPGDPTELLGDPRLSKAEREQIGALYGLDKPIPIQYLNWMGGVARGDLGTSVVHHRSATQVLAERLPASILLALAALFLEHVLGLLIGVTSTFRRGTFLDRQLRNLALVLFSLPIFWLGLVLIDVFAVRVGLFPINMMRSDNAAAFTPIGQVLDVLHHLTLPALTLALAGCGGVARFVRRGLAEILDRDYIRSARALGLGPWRILWRHALRNTLSPLLQRLGVALPALMSGTLILEVIFAWPGVGSATFEAILQRDYPVILASTILSGVLAIGSTLLVDVLLAWVDPRVRDAV